MDESDLDILAEFKDEIVGLHADLVSRNGIKDGYFKGIAPDLIYV